MYNSLIEAMDGILHDAFDQYYRELAEPDTPERKALVNAMLSELMQDVTHMGARIRDYGQRLRTGNI